MNAETVYLKFLSKQSKPYPASKRERKVQAIFFESLLSIVRNTQTSRQFQMELEYHAGLV